MIAAIQTNSAYEVFQRMFSKWCVENNIADKKIVVTEYTKRNPLFSTLDDWRTSVRDDFYTEKENLESPDIEILCKKMEESWMAEIGEEGLEEMEMDESFIYQESSSLFDREYEKWTKREADRLSIER